ncbi:MAG: gliding motility-associated C-terminal domain-containing protein [Chitinophagaceae bacterium]|nr:gliding motility-associated C-terminal domain-containing protein [Chitinophagaceae bacterium]
MRRLPIICILLLALQGHVYARHIKGGELSYKYLGAGSISGTDRFEITLRLFLDCGASGQQLDPDVNIGIFTADAEQPVTGSPFTFPLSGDQTITLGAPNPCINNPSPVCYRLRTYTRIMDLPHQPAGYQLVFQRCCRINDLVNLAPNNNIGSSYTSLIGGSNVLGNQTNSSPTFAIKDTVLICQFREFALDFSADDPDSDSLSYEFIDAYTAPQGSGGGIINPVPPSQIGFVNYTSGFTGETPLGNGVTINRKTGLIKGIAPKGGDYVICVSVKEWRHGLVISEHRKDFNIKVDQQCDLAAALLKPVYPNCDNFSFTFQNESPPSTLIHTYTWDFGVLNSNNDTSHLATPSYTYADTGVYKIKLIINKGEQCTDSAEGLVKVFPGFNPGFTAIGSCVTQPFVFNDTTKARYGVVDSWHWELGDETTIADTSNKKSFNWQYSTVGLKPVTFIVTSSKGCIDTVYQNLDVRVRPTVNLAFRDTIICSIDTLQLVINGPGTYEWLPNYNIINPLTPSPFVFPKQTTTYKVNMNDNGCVNSDSVKVRVVDFVTLDAGADSTICLTDSVILRPNTDAVKFAWTPVNTLNNPSVRNPIAFPTATTTYQLLGSIGKCSATDQVTIKTIPYPLSFAGSDSTVCYDDTATLHATIKGYRFTWSPSASLSNPSSLTTFAYPLKTTIYSLTVFDTLGCPKPGISTVKITVREKINAFAGNDTVVVVNQPLQLTATGAPFYQWTPSTYLNRNDIANPVARLSDNFRYIVKVYNELGCSAFDTIAIKVFKTLPDIFVPNAFSPNGKNRVLRPIPVGISKFDYFRVYNRWGQLVYQTTSSGAGWDGAIAGKPQDSGTFIWMVQGVDYTGKTIVKRGTAVLIR